MKLLTPTDNNKPHSSQFYLYSPHQELPQRGLIIIISFYTTKTVQQQYHLN